MLGQLRSKNQDGYITEPSFLMTEVSRNHSGKIRRDIIAAHAERVEESKAAAAR
ncbi:hypothetical protein SPRA44_140116 [Serratia proteamaculans]|nr:hypothetical protein SPRA44_140116 [Serratia proteamaculans]